MAEPKKPQDHKQKAKKVDPDAVFSFELDGKAYTFTRPTSEVITPGFVRKNRNAPAEFLYAALEELADAETLDALDNTSHKQWSKIAQAFDEHQADILGANLGE